MTTGDRFVMRTSGGGGLGRPEARDSERVLADVAAGRVTPEAARLVYGVVLDDDGEAVDVAATDQLRGERVEAGR
jgi:N-methylhydantoinase B